VSTGRRIVIAGHGVAGLSAAQAARAQDPAAQITLLGNEEHDAYYRPRLSHDLRTGIEIDKMRLRPPNWYQGQQIEVLRSALVTVIDPAGRTVAVEGISDPLPYDACVIATGAMSFMPPISGGGRAGVFTLRGAADAQAIRARAAQVSVAAVAGGGLLGLEAAYGLAGVVDKVIVLERGPWLLRRQLDREGGQLLAEVLHRAGITVMTGAEVEAALGAGSGAAPEEGRVVSEDEPLAELLLKSGERLACGLLVVAAGVRPAVGLAEAAGIRCDRGGVIVDDAMLTSDDRIYACGDVASHPAGNYSIWPQAMAQGRVAGANAAGGSASYQPVVPQNLLEVAGTSVFAVGEVGDVSDQGEDLVEISRRDDGAGRYVKLRVRGGRLAGAMLIGEPELAKKLRGPVEAQLDVHEALGAPEAERLERVLAKL